MIQLDDVIKEELKGNPGLSFESLKGRVSNKHPGQWAEAEIFATFYTLCKNRKVGKKNGGYFWREAA